MSKFSFTPIGLSDDREEETNNTLFLLYFRISSRGNATCEISLQSAALTGIEDTDFDLFVKRTECRNKTGKYETNSSVNMNKITVIKM